MRQTGLFENWQIREELPMPFKEEVKKRKGICFSTDPADCSSYNTVTRGKKATLYPFILNAILKLIEAETSKYRVAAGVQLGPQDEVQYYCMEYNVNKDVYVVVYNPRNGKLQGGKMLQPEFTGEIAMLEAGKNNGEMFAAMFVFASIVKGDFLNHEFVNNYNFLKEQYAQGWPDREAVMNAAYVCCDNLFWRLEGGLIPFDEKAFECGNVEHLGFQKIQSGVYSPNKVFFGKFLVFEKQERKVVYQIGALQKMYGQNHMFPDQIARLIPCLPDSYKAGTEIVKILKMITQTPVRTFLITGSAGIGKSTDAKIIAQVLGVPYYYFTCGPNTDEMDLTASMVPNTSQYVHKEEEFPGYEDMMMDPATALCTVTGVYQAGISCEEAFQKILEAVSQSGYQRAKRERDFVMVESQIVEACKRPSVLEIQEPTVMERPATLAKLNALLDDTAAIELLNGEVIRRNPETVIILTTNVNYIGCRQFNESVLSRMGLVQHRTDMTARQMVERVSEKTGLQDLELLEKMAEIAVSIREHIKEEDLHGGICEYREYEDWVWSYLVQHNILEAAKDTVVAKASMVEEDREEIMASYVQPYFSDNAA